MLPFVGLLSKRPVFTSSGRRSWAPTKTRRSEKKTQKKRTDGLDEKKDGPACASVVLLGGQGREPNLPATRNLGCVRLSSFCPSLLTFCSPSRYKSVKFEIVFRRLLRSRSQVCCSCLSTAPIDGDYEPLKESDPEIGRGAVSLLLDLKEEYYPIPCRRVVSFCHAVPALRLSAKRCGDESYGVQHYRVRVGFMLRILHMLACPTRGKGRHAGKAQRSNTKGAGDHVDNSEVSKGYLVVWERVVEEFHRGISARGPGYAVPAPVVVGFVHPPLPGPIRS